VSRVYLFVLGRGRVRLFRRSRAAIRDGIIKGTGIEWSINVRAHATNRVIAPCLWSLVEIGNSNGMRRQANQGDSTHDYYPTCYNSNRDDCGVYNY
jgi:hypothetical protein